MTASSRRPLVMVLGMHRSGTSLCANVLAALGVDMAEQAAPSPENPRGHWERHRINDLHDEVFAMHGARWTDAGHNLALPDRWWEAPAIAGVADRIAAYLAPILAQSNLAGFKDPRTARLLPMWGPILDRLDAEPRFILCLRDPSQVARSLEARDRSARAQAEYRWLIYNAHAVHGIGLRPVCIIPYQDWFDAPLPTARRLAQWIAPEKPYDDNKLRQIVDATVDATLRHDPAGPPQTATKTARKLHDTIGASAGHDDFAPSLIDYAAHFLDFEQAVTPLLREAVILRASVADQNRVIRDLQSAIAQLRQTRAS